MAWVWGLLGWFALGGSLAAHPIFYDNWTVNIRSNRVETLYSTTLHEVAVAQRIDTNKVANVGFAVWLSAVSNHANYVSSHLYTSVNGEAATWRVTDFQIRADSAANDGKADDLETTRALIYLESAVSTNQFDHAILSHSMMDGFSYSPGIPWSVVAQASVRAPNGVLLGESALLRGQKWRLDAPEPSETGAGPSVTARSGSFVVAGLFHVWEGWDHLLFLLGLVLAVKTMRELSYLILIFTGAHSLTITLAAYGLVHVSPAIVEPGISASIVAVAVLNLLSLRRRVAGNRYFAAGGFGLLHGLGFASGLTASTGGASGFDLALKVAGFCLGVELAHAAVGLPAFLVLRKVGSSPDGGAPKALVRWGSWGVAAGGTIMLIQAAREYW